jgi:hypothetical protein
VRPRSRCLILRHLQGLPASLLPSLRLSSPRASVSGANIHMSISRVFKDSHKKLVSAYLVRDVKIKAGTEPT